MKWKLNHLIINYFVTILVYESPFLRKLQKNWKNDQTNQYSTQSDTTLKDKLLMKHKTIKTNKIIMK